MKKLMYLGPIGLVFLSTLVFGARYVDVDALRSADHTKTWTPPSATDTLVGRASTDTLTNKTLTGNTAVNLISGAGTLTLNTSGTATVPNATDTLVGKATTDTLTNKTLTGNTAVNLISGAGILTLNTSGTATVPSATDTLVGKATTDTLTNKTIAAGSNTISGLANGNLSGSAAITNANLATMSAHTYKGNNTGSTAAAADISAANVLADTSPLTTKGDLATFSTVNARQAVGTDGQVLTADSTQTTGIKWVTGSAGSQISDTSELLNLGLSVTAGSGILTIALKQSDGSTDPASGVGAVKASMRSNTAATGAYLERSVVAALSQTLTSGTTLGMAASQNNYLWLYLIDSDGAGTMKLGASTTKLDVATLQSAVSESASVTATNASPCVFTETGHLRNNGDALTLTGTPPTGFSLATTYYIVSAAANTYQLSATPGGTAINSSSTGTSVVARTASARLASNAPYSLKPVALIGRAQVNLATSGTWLTPVELSAGIIVVPETVEMRSTTITSTSIPTSMAVMPFNVLVKDTHNAYNTSTGLYTCPVSGMYSVKAVIFTAALTLTTSQGLQLAVFKNGGGSPYSYLGQTFGAGGGGQAYGVSGGDDIPCNAGDTLGIYAQAGAVGGLSTNAGFNHLSIVRVGN